MIEHPSTESYLTSRVLFTEQIGMAPHALKNALCKQGSTSDAEFIEHFIDIFTDHQILISICGLKS